MEKKLLIEINRTLGLMSIDKKILSEQWGQSIEKALINLGKKFETKFTSSVEKLLGKDISQATEAEIKNVLKNAELSQLTKKIANKITDNNFELIDDVFNKINKNDAAQLSSAYSELSGKLGIDKDWVKIVKDSYKEKISKSIPHRYKPIGEVESLTSKELKKLYSSNTFLINFKSLVRWGKDQFTSENKLIDEALSLIKTYGELGSGDSTKKTNIINRLDEVILTLGQKRKDSKGYINHWIDDNISDRVIRGKLKDLKGYKAITSLSEGKTKEDWIKNHGDFLKRRSELSKNLRGFVNPAKWTGKSLKNNYEGSVAKRWKDVLKGDNFKRLRNDYKWGMTLSPKDIVEYTKLFGLPSGVGLLAKEWIYSYLIIEALDSVLDYITDVNGHLLIDVYPENWAGRNTIVSHAKRYGLHFDNNDSDIKSGLDWITPYLKYISDNLLTLSSFIPGLIDDTYRGVNKLFNAIVYHKEINPEDVKTLKEDVKKVKDVVEKKGEEAKAKVETVVDKIENTEPGFRAWCLKNKKNFVSFGSDKIGYTNETPPNNSYTFNGNTFVPY